MKRVIDFQISYNAGIPPIYGYPVTQSDIVRVEYESSFSYPEVNKVMAEAEDALRKQIGHDDYVINYWWWIQ